MVKGPERRVRKGKEKRRGGEMRDGGRRKGGNGKEREGKGTTTTTTTSSLTTSYAGHSIDQNNRPKQIHCNVKTASQQIFF